MSTVRYSFSGASLALAALIAGSAALLAPAALEAAPSKTAQKSSVSAQASVKADRNAKTQTRAKADKTARSDKDLKLPASAEPQYTSAITPKVEDDNCLRHRRKLWVDGEGWIVRKVAICH